MLGPYFKKLPAEIVKIIFGFFCGRKVALKGNLQVLARFRLTCKDNANFIKNYCEPLLLRQIAEVIKQMKIDSYRHSISNRYMGVDDYENSKERRLEAKAIYGQIRFCFSEIQNKFQLKPSSGVQEEVFSEALIGQLDRDFLYQICCFFNYNLGDSLNRDSDIYLLKENDPFKFFENICVHISSLESCGTFCHLPGTASMCHIESISRFIRGFLDKNSNYKLMLMQYYGVKIQEGKDDEKLRKKYNLGRMGKLEELLLWMLIDEEYAKQHLDATLKALPEEIKKAAEGGCFCLNTKLEQVDDLPGRKNEIFEIISNFYLGLDEGSVDFELKASVALYLGKIFAYFGKAEQINIEDNVVDKLIIDFCKMITEYQKNYSCLYLGLFSTIFKYLSNIYEACRRDIFKLAMFCTSLLNDIKGNGMGDKPHGLPDKAIETIFKIKKNNPGLKIDSQLEEVYGFVMTYLEKGDLWKKVHEFDPYEHLYTLSRYFPSKRDLIKGTLWEALFSGEEEMEEQLAIFESLLSFIENEYAVFSEEENKKMYDFINEIVFNKCEKLDGNCVDLFVLLGKFVPDYQNKVKDKLFGYVRLNINNEHRYEGAILCVLGLVELQDDNSKVLNEEEALFLNSLIKNWSEKSEKENRDIWEACSKILAVCMS